MKLRKIAMVGIICLALYGLTGCATNTPWKLATVSTFELVGGGVSIAKDTAIILNQQKVLSDKKLADAKELYNKAVKVYAAMGNALKLAGQAESAVKRDEFLNEYTKLLGEFGVLSSNIYFLIKDLQK